MLFTIDDLSTFPTRHFEGLFGSITVLSSVIWVVSGLLLCYKVENAERSDGAGVGERRLYVWFCSFPTVRLQ